MLYCNWHAVNAADDTVSRCTFHMLAQLQGAVHTALCWRSNVRFTVMCDLLQIIELYVRGITVRGLADPRHW